MRGLSPPGPLAFLRAQSWCQHLDTHSSPGTSCDFNQFGVQKGQDGLMLGDNTAGLVPMCVATHIGLQDRDGQLCRVQSWWVLSRERWDGSQVDYLLGIRSILEPSEDHSVSSNWAWPSPMFSQQPVSANGQFVLTVVLHRLPATNGCVLGSAINDINTMRRRNNNSAATQTPRSGFK